MSLPPITLQPIGIVRSPLTTPSEAARQPYAAAGVEGAIELFPDRHYEDAVCDLAGFDHIWVVFHFHRAEGWRPKVLPPRSVKGKRGVFATRSPHRPNPIGLSVLQLVAVEGLVLRVAGLDILDETPVLDIKPYLAYADCVPDAATGWVGAQTVDPDPGFEVRWGPLAIDKIGWLEAEHDISLRPAVDRALALGPQPHAYRRIKRDGPRGRLAVKDWRFDFEVAGRIITVVDVQSGYRARDGKASGVPAVHAAFGLRFGTPRA